VVAAWLVYLGALLVIVAWRGINAKPVWAGRDTIVAACVVHLRLWARHESKEGCRRQPARSAIGARVHREMIHCSPQQSEFGSGAGRVSLGACRMFCAAKTETAERAGRLNPCPGTVSRAETVVPQRAAHRLFHSGVDRGVTLGVAVLIIVLA